MFNLAQTTTNFKGKGQREEWRLSNYWAHVAAKYESNIYVVVKMQEQHPAIELNAVCVCASQIHSIITSLKC